MPDSPEIQAVEAVCRCTPPVMGPPTEPPGEDVALTKGESLGRYVVLGLRRARRHGRGLRRLRSGAGPQGRAQAAARAAAPALADGRRHAPPARGAGDRAPVAPERRRRLRRRHVRATASSSRWSSSRATRSATGCRRAPRTLARDRWTSSWPRGAGWRPRTRRASSTATSSPTTSWSASDGQVRVMDFGLARQAGDGGRAAPTTARTAARAAAAGGRAADGDARRPHDEARRRRASRRRSPAPARTWRSS